MILLEFLTIAALWGGSFLFMRVAGPQFGPVPLIGMRVAIASAFLLPLCVMRGELGAIKIHWKQIWILGLTSAAIPFSLLAYTTIQTNAGFGSVLNSTAPFFTAIIAWIWLKDRPTPAQIAGLFIGFLGVVWLVQGKKPFVGPLQADALIAALGATSLYGFTTNYTKRYLQGISPLVITTISQVSAALFMLPFIIWLWPGTMPNAHAWSSVILLGIFSTGIAFILFFRLVARIGASKTIIVTFLIPVFGMLWGVIFLRENVTGSMLGATAVILLGTALSTGVFKK